MRNSKITIINNNKKILDIDIYFRLNILFSRGLIDQTQKKQKFCYSDGCVFDILYKDHNCVININYDYKCTKRKEIL